MAVTPSNPSTWGARALGPFALGDRAARHLPIVLSIVRILFGLMIVHQMVDIFGFAMLTGGPDPRIIRLISGVAALGGVLLAFGMLTPLAIVGLLICYAQPLVFNLGTMVSVVLLWGLLLHGAGRTHSVDALLLRSHWTGKWLARLYAPFGTGGDQETAGIRLLVLLMFWGHCLTAMLYHLQDAFWLNGQVLQMALTAAYLSDHSSFTAAMREQYPRFFVAFCQVGLGIQAAWEVLLLPLMYLKWARPFVVLQGLGFFTISLLLLNLQYLPVVELLLWTLLFGPAVLGWVLEKWPRVAPMVSIAEVPAPVAPHLTIARHLPTLLALACCAIVFQNVLAPGLVPNALTEPVKPIRKALSPLFKLFGQDVISVFNQVDISMNDAYFVLQEVDAAGRHLRIVPFLDTEGGRLDYMRNDLLYFNYSLRWQRISRQRKFIAGDPARPASSTRQIAFRVALLDAVLTDPSRPRHYRAHVYVREMLLDMRPPRWSEAQRTASFPVDFTVANHLGRYQATNWPTFDLPPGQAFAGERLKRTEAAIIQALAEATEPGARVQKLAP